MESALYDPEAGYYNTGRPKIGPAGDYYTSSNVHAAFGACIARLFSELLDRRESDRPGRHEKLSARTAGRCAILEAGAGTGQLAVDILAALQAEHPALYSRVSYVIAERSPAMEARQHEKLGQYLDKVEWLKVTSQGLPDVESIDGIIFSNELIDALPVHVIRAAAEGLEELYVVCGNGQSADEWPIQNPSLGLETDAPGSSGHTRSEFSFAWGAPSSERIKQYIERMNVALSPGLVAEVSLDAVDWLKAAASVLNNGYLVTVDYGDIAPHLYGEDRRDGTLRAFYKHALAPSVLERPGEQDITSSVNFTALMEYGRDAGLETVSFERQSAFLFRMGLLDRIAAMGSQTADPTADLKNRLAIKSLFVPGGSSDNFRVLIQQKRIP
jgi:SAM-dependent MidA family methyltransferase